MNHCFPEVVMLEQSTYEKNYIDRKILNEWFFCRYLHKKIEGWSICDYLNENRIYKYALYAKTDIAKIILEDIRNNDNQIFPLIIGALDADKDGYDFFGCKAVMPDELGRRYADGEITKIIVTSVLHENEIIPSLIKLGIQQMDIIPITSILFSRLQIDILVRKGRKEY